MQHVYNRFNTDSNIEAHIFRADKTLQSAELNEVQSASHHRLKNIADVLFKNGDLVRDARISVDPHSGATHCESGAVYLNGAVRGVAPADITIPVIGTIAVGVYLQENIITELDDPTLLNPAVGTRGYMQPGAARQIMEINWGHQNDGQNGSFYPIYTVDDGYVRAKEPPPNLDAVTQALARYDRDSTGSNYVVQGMQVRMDSDTEVNGQTLQTYHLAEGRAHVFGLKIEQQAARRIHYAATPELLLVDSEPHISATDAAQTITLDRPPCAGTPEVRIVARKVASVVHGGFNGAADPLPNTSVVAIDSIKQGATVYKAVIDYKLVAGQIDWSPNGAEPAPGSTYEVTYQHMVNRAISNVTPRSFEVEGAIQGSTVLVTYAQQLPRIDRLCINAEGAIVWLRGTATPWSPAAPSVPDDLLCLASVQQTWDAHRRLVPDGIRMVPMASMAGLFNDIAFLREDQAELRLAVDAQGRDSGVKKGLYADPFLSDGMRDAGRTQTGAILGGALRLPIETVAHSLALDITTPQAPAHNYRTALTQPMRTGTMRVNPYNAFEPLPAAVTLTPAVDRWMEVVDQWSSARTERLYGINLYYRPPSVSIQILGETSTAIEHLRSISVGFEINGFGAGESIRTLTFDGIPVTPAPLPGQTLQATAAGVLRGSFVIPDGIPAGIRQVQFIGEGGSTAWQLFDGQGTHVLRNKQQVTTHYLYSDTSSAPSSGGGSGGATCGPDGDNSWNVPAKPSQGACVGPGDPLAQTFTLDRGLQIAGVHLWFSAVGKTCIVQIRETQTGMPSAKILIETRVSIASIATDGSATRITWAPLFLQAAQEYALVIMSDDATTAVSIAELGKWDANAGQWVTSQPYQVGVLLSSSNASTWTPHQDRDLAFNLLAADYTQTECSIDLGEATVSNMTDAMVLGFAERPGTEAECYFELDCTIADKVETLVLAPGQVVWLSAPYSGKVKTRAKLKGNAQTAAILHPGVQLIAGTIANEADYISRTINAGTNVRLKVVYEAYLPAGSSVRAEMQADDPNASAADNANAPWQDIPYKSSTSNSSSIGLREMVHELTSVNAPRLRVRLTLLGSTVARPYVRNLRVIVL